MKKFQTMAYVVALALVSTAGLSSCKSDEPGDGNYNGETVKTEFAINLPKQVADDNSGMSRMPSATVQKNGASQFQGITGIWLVPFARQGAIIDSDARLGNNIHLTGDVTAADIAKPSKAKAYSNVSIPLSTASFLFYAKSGATGGTGTEPQKMFRVGALIPSDTANTNPSAFKFDLKQIQNSSSVSTMMAASNEGGKLMQYLTSVAIASDGAGTPKRWYEYTVGDDAALTAMFTTFTSMKGLSSFEVERVLTLVDITGRYPYSAACDRFLHGCPREQVFCFRISDLLAFPVSSPLCVFSAVDNSAAGFSRGISTDIIVIVISFKTGEIAPAQSGFTVITHLLYDPASQEIRRNSRILSGIIDDLRIIILIIAVHKGAGIDLIKIGTHIPGGLVHFKPRRQIS